MPCVLSCQFLAFRYRFSKTKWSATKYYDIPKKYNIVFFGKKVYATMRIFVDFKLQQLALINQCIYIKITKQLRKALLI